MSLNPSSKQPSQIEEKSPSVSTDASSKKSESLKADASQPQKTQAKSAFEIYCDTHPDAAECKIYED